MGSLILAVISGMLFRRSFRRDRRQLRNGFFLACAAWCLLSAVGEFQAYLSPGTGIVWLLIAALLPLSVVVLAIFLIANGFTMIRKEGRRLGNLLSLLAGLAILGLPVLMIILALTLEPVAMGVAGLLFVAAAYFGVFFVIFLGYAAFYAGHPKFLAPDAIVILGSGLIRGEAPPLLQRRIDRAIEIWRAAPAALLIPSGGQGEDEPRPEAAAMAEYMVAQGVPTEAIVQEDRSRNTRENLEFSRAVLDQFAGLGRPAVRDRPEGLEASPGLGRSDALDHATRSQPAGTGDMLVVTSNYHVMRAALLARDIGSSAEVVGAPTAAYYVPSAFLREFAAVLVRHRHMHVFVLLPFVALAALCVFALYSAGV